MDLQDVTLAPYKNFLLFKSQGPIKLLAYSEFQRQGMQAQI